MYPIRGAVTFKSTVGTNVASDALANLASGGVNGGALIIIGEDYGEGSSIMQERSHAFAMKSQIWLLDPRPNLQSIVKAVEDGFELSEASQHAGDAGSAHPRLPRSRQLHRQGQQAAAVHAETGAREPAIATPAGSCCRRPPSCTRKRRSNTAGPRPSNFIKERKLNETFAGDLAEVGIVMQGGMYNGVMRALQRLGLADVWGATRVPLYVMNVTYPLIDDEIVDFCAGKNAVLIVEEGQPEFIEQAIATILRRRDVNTKIFGKDVLPMAGEYTADVALKGVRAFLAGAAPGVITDQARARRTSRTSMTIRGSRRSPMPCRRGRPASAPAARSGRSSPP